MGIFTKTKNITQIFLVYYTDSDLSRVVLDVTESLEDAYYIAANYIKNDEKFDLSLDQTRNHLNSGPDYVNVHNKDISSWDVHEDKVGRYQYYFTIVRSNTVKVIK